MNGRVDFDKWSYEAQMWPEDPLCSQGGTRVFYKGRPMRIAWRGTGTGYNTRPPECRPDVPVVTGAH